MTGINSDTYIVRTADLGYTLAVRVTRSDNSGEQLSEPTPMIIRAVTGITGVTSWATAGIPQTLTATVEPVTATNRTIIWNIKDEGTTGVMISGNVLNTIAAGTVTITAVIPDGTMQGTDFIQDFSITVVDAAPFDQWITRVNFTSSEQTINLHNLDNRDIYLVKVNTSHMVASAAGTGRVMNVIPELNIFPPISRTTITPDELPKMGRPANEECLYIPDQFDTKNPTRSHFSFVPPETGDTRNFWIEANFGRFNFVHRQATLLATGNHGNIWVMNNSLPQQKHNLWLRGLILFIPLRLIY
jgi:hypothetical protein